MKNIKHKVNIQIGNQLFDQIHNQVNFRIWRQIDDQIWDQIIDRFWQIHIQIQNEIRQVKL
jgi:hypothetical protein